MRRSLSLAASVLFTLLTMTSTLAAPQIVAHRGASHDAPENTVAAFREAVRQRSDAIETDLRFTKDGKIIIIHDETTDRTTGVKGKVPEMTFDELRKLDAGKWKNPRFAGERLPGIEETLAEIPAGTVVLLEVKCGPEIVPSLKTAIEQSKLKREQIRIISFNEPVVLAVKKAMPDIPAFFLFNFKKDKEGRWTSTPEELFSRLSAMKPDGLDIQLNDASRELITADFVRKVRQAGMQFHVWTVDDPAVARYAVELGADSITTNRPQFIREQLAQPRK